MYLKTSNTESQPQVSLIHQCVYLAFYPFSAEHVDNLVEHRGPEDVPVNQQSFHSVTCSWIVTLGVSH